MITQERNFNIISERLTLRTSLDKLGQKHGITKERIRQILSRAGIDAKDIDLRRKPKATANCSRCGKSFEISPSKLAPLKEPICSKQCRQDLYRIIVICDTCGKQFKRKRSTEWARNQNGRYSLKFNYCSMSCTGKGRRWITKAVLFLGWKEWNKLSSQAKLGIVTDIRTKAKERGE